MLCQVAENAAYHVGEQGHHLKVIADKAEFDVHADVFVDVARGGMRFGTKHRANLEDALKHANHDLLIELWTLREECTAPEIFHREHVGTAFRRGAYQLRRRDFGEVAGL